jgi:hypothetical protein
MKEPVSIDYFDYTIELVSALNYYNTEHDEKSKKLWVYEYCITKSIDCSSLDALPLTAFKTLGALARMSTNKVGLSVTDENRLSNLISELIAGSKTLPTHEHIKSERKAPVAPKSKQNEILIELDMLTDKFCSGADVDVCAKSFLMRCSFVKKDAKEAMVWVINKKNEIGCVVNGTEQDLVDAYSGYKKKTVLKFYTFLVNLEKELSRKINR